MYEDAVKLFEHIRQSPHIEIGDKTYDAACLACKLAGNETLYSELREEMKAKSIAYYSEMNE